MHHSKNISSNSVSPTQLFFCSVTITFAPNSASTAWALQTGTPRAEGPFRFLTWCHPCSSLKAEGCYFQRQNEKIHTQTLQNWEFSAWPTLQHVTLLLEGKNQDPREGRRAGSTGCSWDWGFGNNPPVCFWVGFGSFLHKTQLHWDLALGRWCLEESPQLQLIFNVIKKMA